LKQALATDVEGNVLVVGVHSAAIQERDSLKSIVSTLLKKFPTIRKIWVDGGFSGEPLQQWMQDNHPGVSLEVVTKLPDQKGFQVLKRRWVCERTFGWFSQNRRLNRHHEGSFLAHRAMILVSTIKTFIRKLKIF
jgi:putative transposase